MRVGSLFSGIGGLDLGLERAGMDIAWHSEIDPYACRVLAKHWPDVPNLGDITTIDWSTVEPVDLICGGYPCQPFSLAGVRAGEADPRHLWPHFARAIRELRPRYALLENVPGHLSLGFGRVLGDLADLGFDAQWDCIPAAAVGAPHLRYRIFVVAYADEQQHEGRSSSVGWSGASNVPANAERDELRVEPIGIGRSRCTAVAQHDGEVGTLANSDGGRQPRDSEAKRVRREVHAGEIERLGRCGGGIGGTWTTEPDVGRVAHGVPARVDRLRTLGNAVVPPVAEYVGRQILAAAA